MNTFSLFFAREWTLLWRNSSAIGQPLCLFILISLLFPFSLPASSINDAHILGVLGGGIIWVAVLLATMLSLENIFKDDLRDGLIEQWLIGHRSLSIAMLAKVCAHWCTTSIALIICAPIIAGIYGVAIEQFGVLLLTLVLGTPILILIGAIGAALTVTLERSGLLITIVTLPLTIPVLIFGASAMANAAQGFSIKTELYALGSMLSLTLTLAPYAIASALRLTIE